MPVGYINPEKFQTATKMEIQDEVYVRKSKARERMPRELIFACRYKWEKQKFCTAKFVLLSSSI